MPPIQIYSKSPINASKVPNDISPRKSKSNYDDTSAVIGGTLPTLTEDAALPQSSPAANLSYLPGPAAPATKTENVKCNAPQPIHQSDASSIPFRSQVWGDDEPPPPPQPGAVPIVPGRSTLPPPPNVAQSLNTVEQAQAPHQTDIPMPHQMQMTAPYQPISPAQRGTSTTIMPQAPDPFNFVHSPFKSPGRQPTLESAYQQNTTRQIHGLGTYPGQVPQDDAEEGILNSAMKWANAAGRKLSEAESEVWRRINKD